jgi:hypothetical protein
MIIYCSKPGALGNQLFVFAHLIAFSEEYNYPIRMVAFDRYYKYFEGTHKNCLLSYPIKINLPPLFPKFSYKFYYYVARITDKFSINNAFIKTIHLDWSDKIVLNSPEFLSVLNKHKYIFLQGWQYRTTNNLLLKHKEKIKGFFKIRDKYIFTMKKKIDELRNKYEIIFGIHIRRGDYRKFEDGKFFYDWSMYKNWMIKIKKEFFFDKKVIFFACSDELIPDEFKQLNVPVYISNHTFIEDIYALSQCDYILGPPSTFSIWASYINDVPLYMLHHRDDFPESISKFKVCFL